MIGPKLYEANWLDLSNQGFIARVKCFEVLCPMLPSFMSEYFKTTSNSKKDLLSVMNPNKIRACHYLIKSHEEKGHKILVFSDNVFALKVYANAIGRPFIYGKTSEKSRISTFSDFKYNPTCKCLFISRVGDNR